MSDDTPIWYVLRTPPQREGEAQAWLTGHRKLVRHQTRQILDGTPTPIRIPRARPEPRRDGNGVICIVPIEQVWRYTNKSARRKRPRNIPLMPGWLLAGFRAPVNWFHLFTSGYISGVACQNGAPAEVPEQRIQAFLDRNSNGFFTAANYKARMRSRREFDPGDRVEILEGVFEGLSFQVDRIDEFDAHGLLDIFGRPVDVSIPVENLARVG